MFQEESGLTKYPSIEVSLSKLYLKLDNPRHAYTASSQQEVINWFVREHATKKIHYLKELMKDIVSYGGLFNNPFVIEKEKGRYEVVDGNTRVTALKLLKDPNLLKVEHKLLTKEWLKNISSQYINNNDMVEVKLVPAEDENDIITHQHIPGYMHQKPLTPEAQSYYTKDWYFDMQEIYDPEGEMTLSKYLWERYLNVKDSSKYIGVKIGSNDELIYTTSKGVAQKRIKKLAKIMQNGPKGQVRAEELKNIIKNTFPEEVPISFDSDKTQRKPTEQLTFGDNYKDTTDNVNSENNKNTRKKKTDYGIRDKDNLKKFFTDIFQTINKITCPHSKISDLNIYELIHQLSEFNPDKFYVIGGIILRSLMEGFCSLYMIICEKHEKIDYKKDLIDTLNSLAEKKKFRYEKITYYKNLNKTFCEFVHLTNKITKKEDFYTNFNNLKPLIEIIMKEIS